MASLQHLELPLRLNDVFFLRQWQTPNPLESRCKVGLEGHSRPVQPDMAMRVDFRPVRKVETHAVLFRLEEEGWLITQAGSLGENQWLCASLSQINEIDALLTSLCDKWEGLHIEARKRGEVSCRRVRARISVDSDALPVVKQDDMAGRSGYEQLVRRKLQERSDQLTPE